ncbi:hypothetical protein RI367_005904 [Sorochytrium milnesiophthora]
MSSITTTTAAPAATFIPQVLVPSPVQVNKTSLGTKQMWCTSQTQICLNVCNYQVVNGGNLCYPTTLQYTCTCADGRTPITDADVDLTLPYFTCTYYFLTPCLNSCGPGNQACVDSCNNQYICGHVKANPNITTTTDASAPTASSTSTPNLTINSGAQSLSFGAWTLVSAAGALAVAML